jgi:uncharacterized membrane protein YkoI
MLARFTALTALLSIVAGTAAYAEDRKDARQREAVDAAKVKPNDAAEIARRVVPDGKVVDVDVETIKGTVIYAVEIEKDGRVRSVLVDLSSGDVLRVQPKSEDDDDDSDDDDDHDDSDDDDDHDDRRGRRG